MFGYDVTVMGLKPCRSEFGARYRGPNRMIFLMTNPTVTPIWRGIAEE
jgi:hypothetical protein